MWTRADIQKMASEYSSTPSRCFWCREHYKILIIFIVFLLVAQYVTNLFVYVQTDDFSISFWRQLPQKLPNILFAFDQDSSKKAFPSSTLRVTMQTSTLSSTFAPIPSTIATHIISAAVSRNNTSPASSASLLADTVTIPNYDEQDVPQPNQTCPVVPPNLVGALNVSIEKKTFSQLEEMHKELPVNSGGHWKPPHCMSRYKVAIIIPYRDRAEQLQVFLAHMHPFLQKQELDYSIYIIDQVKGELFNRAMLMNVGYMESLKDYNWECFVFHDVDLLPENDNNIYSCPAQPRHMSVAIDVMGYKLPYSDIFGGASALTREQFEKINGFSNWFWGWGGEDDDLANRVKKRGKYHIIRYKPEIARYKMIRHGHEAGNKANPKRFKLLYDGHKRFDKDGLSSLNYTLLQREKLQLYTWVYVNITKPPTL